MNLVANNGYLEDFAQFRYIETLPKVLELDLERHLQKSIWHSRIDKSVTWEALNVQDSIEIWVILLSGLGLKSFIGKAKFIFI